MPTIDRPIGSASTPSTTPVDATNAAPVDATTATTVTTATTNATTSAPAGLDAATGAGPAPSGAGQVSAPIGASVSLPRLVDVGPPKLALLPGYPQCVGLPDVLAKLGQSPAAGAALDHVFAQFQQETGIAIPAALQASIKAHPERIADAFVVTPRQMRAGFDALNAAARAGKLPPTKPKERQLPQNVDLATFDFNSLTRSAGDLKEVVPGSGLWKGDVPSSTIGDAQAKQNIGAAEIFDRLAENSMKAAGDPALFTVTYQGKPCTSVGDLVDALRADGCTITAHIDYRAADFAALKVKNPAAPDGVLDVPAAVLVRTGIRDAKGREAIVPAVHGELIFHVEKGPNTKGPGLDADFKFYQGVPDTGFFACDTNRRSTWLGRTTPATFTGDDAVRAAKLAANEGDVLNAVAKKDGLWMNGYGVTGVCLDSVGDIEMALTGKVSGFPLFMRHQLVLDEVNARLHDANGADDADMQAIAAAIEKMPDDGHKNASQKERVLASMPWTKATAPVQCVADALDILGA